MSTRTRSNITPGLKKNITCVLPKYIYSKIKMQLCKREDVSVDAGCIKRITLTWVVRFGNNVLTEGRDCDFD